MKILEGEDEFYPRNVRQVDEDPRSLEFQVVTEKKSEGKGFGKGGGRKRG